MEKFTIKQLLESGVHYGHHTRRWNPAMAQYIYGVYNNVHIINLQKTAPLLANALNQIKEIVANKGRILFVGTKKQAAEIVKEYAEQCGQYYINNRWLGGTLTNWTTITKSIKKLVKNEGHLEQGMEGYTKKERLSFMRENEKLNLNLGGIRNMGGVPDALFVIDAKKEEIAIKEAKKLNIPVIAVVDTNSNPSLVDFPIPGNDDAIKAITLYCELVSAAVLEGLELEAKLHVKKQEANVIKKMHNEAKEETPKGAGAKKETTAKDDTKVKQVKTSKQDVAEMVDVSETKDNSEKL